MEAAPGDANRHPGRKTPYWKTQKETGGEVLFPSAPTLEVHPNPGSEAKSTTDDVIFPRGLAWRQPNPREHWREEPALPPCFEAGSGRCAREASTRWGTTFCSRDGPATLAEGHSSCGERRRGGTQTRIRPNRQSNGDTHDRSVLGSSFFGASSCGWPDRGALRHLRERRRTEFAPGRPTERKRVAALRQRPLSKEEDSAGDQAARRRGRSTRSPAARNVSVAGSGVTTTLSIRAKSSAPALGSVEAPALISN